MGWSHSIFISMYFYDCCIDNKLIIEYDGSGYWHPIEKKDHDIKKEIFDVNDDKTEFSPSQLEESPLVTKELKEELVAMLNDKSAMKKISQINSNDIDSLKQNKQKLTKRKTKRDENDNEDIDFKEI